MVKHSLMRHHENDIFIGNVTRLFYKLCTYNKLSKKTTNRVCLYQHEWDPKKEIIGKSIFLPCFKNGKSLLLKYKTNRRRAWMKSELFETEK